MSAATPTTPWLWRIIAVVTLLFGWFFILFHNKFNVTVPVVIVGLGYFAAVATLLNLWRVGAAAVMPEDGTQEAWSRPLGARGELEKEKKTLLKSIKEAEFDLAMGKLSKGDADELIGMYRARAIEVIKELDRMDSEGGGGTTREKIEREVAARLALEQDKKQKGKKKKGQKGSKGKDEEKAKVEATDASPETSAETDEAVPPEPEANEEPKEATP